MVLVECTVQGRRLLSQQGQVSTSQEGQNVLELLTRIEGQRLSLQELMADDNRDTHDRVLRLLKSGFLAIVSSGVNLGEYGVQTAR